MSRIDENVGEQKSLREERAELIRQALLENKLVQVLIALEELPPDTPIPGHEDDLYEDEDGAEEEPEETPAPEKIDLTEVAQQELVRFLHDRLKVHLREQGIRHDVIDAVIAMPGNDDLTLLVKRAEALSAVLQAEDGENLVQGFKRANNILTQAEEQDGVAYEFGADRKFMEAPEEIALMDALDAADAVIGPAMEREDFGAAMGAMAALRGPIDAFFEAVQVNTENQIVRRNRLNMLHRIRATCLSVADLTRLES